MQVKMSELYEVIGFGASMFIGQDRKEVHGIRIHLGQEVPDFQGKKVSSFFITHEKWAMINYHPAVSELVLPMFDPNGKIKGFVKDYTLE